MKKFMIILGILVAIFIIALINANMMNIEVYFTNLTNKDVLPKEYENFYDVDSKKEATFGVNKKYKISLLYESFDPIKHFISSNFNLIVVTSAIPTDHDKKELENDFLSGGERLIQNFTYHKIDSNGNEIDQLVFKQNLNNLSEKLFGDYIVNIYQKYYRTWIIDGDKTQKPMILQNEDYTWSDEQQISLFKKIIEDADFLDIDGYNYGSEGDRPKQKFTYFMDGKCYQFYTNCILPRKGSSDGFGNTNYASLFGRYEENLVGSDPDWTPFTILYYQRLKQVITTHNTGGGAGGFESKTWEGELYCKLKVDGEYLYFKKPLSINEGGSNSIYFETKGSDFRKLQRDFQNAYYPYFYYSYSQFNFKLFTTNPKQLYTIKPVL